MQPRTYEDTTKWLRAFVVAQRSSARPYLEQFLATAPRAAYRKDLESVAALLRRSGARGLGDAAFEVRKPVLIGVALARCVGACGEQPDRKQHVCARDEHELLNRRL